MPSTAFVVVANEWVDHNTHDHYYYYQQQQQQQHRNYCWGCANLQ
jgi:hypothetical protein